MIEGNCHCRKISSRTAEKPATSMDCNWLLCRRTGPPWGHIPIAAANISAPGNATVIYVQGDRSLAVQCCNSSGRTTHGETLNPGDSDHMTLNFRMCDPGIIDKFRTGPFEGADSRTFLH